MVKECDHTTLNEDVNKKMEMLKNAQIFCCHRNRSNAFVRKERNKGFKILKNL